MSVPFAPTAGFRVGPWEVWPDRHELRQGDEVRRLQPRLMALLACLAEQPGQTCTREQLLLRVWPRKVLNDEVLSRSIADLRIALDDDAREPRFIETIPKLGYRLLAAVTSLPAPAPLPMVQSIVGDEDARVVPSPIMPVRARQSAPWWRVAGAAVLVLGVFAAIFSWSRRAPAPPDGAAEMIRRVLTAQPMTSTPGAELRPRFAAAAPWLAWSAEADAGEHLHLWLRSRDGTTLRQLTDGAVRDLCPLFADDDRTVYFQRSLPDRNCVLMRMPVVGGEPQSVAACSHAGSCPDLWPDGQSLLLTAPPQGPGEAAGIARLFLADGRIERLTRPTLAEGDDLEPRASPWSDAFVFQRGRTGETRLWTWTGADASPRRLPAPAGMYYGSTWLDPQRLLVATDAAGFRALHVLDLDSGSLTLVGARGARHPQRATDGSLAWEQASYDTNLWLFQGRAAPRRLTSSARYDAFPRLSPDGRLLAYQSNREGSDLVYLMDLTDGTEQTLPLDPQWRWAHPAWRRDGRALWLTAYRPEGTELWSWSLGAARPERHVEVRAGSHDAAPDPERADRLWYLRGDGEQTALYRQDERSDPHRIAEKVVQYQVHGDYLYHVSHGSDQVWRCALADPEKCTVLPLKLARGQDRNWVATDRSLWFAAPGGQTLSRLLLGSGQIETTDKPLTGSLTRAMDASADDSLLVITRLDALEVDLYWSQPAR